MNKKTIKNYVLDTNVVLSDPRAIYAFAEHNVIIPIPVLEEVESFKKGQAERNHQARAFLRELKALKEGNPQMPKSGYPLKTGGNLIFKPTSPQEARLKIFEANTVDHQLLDLVISMKGSQTKSDRNVVFVTNDEALQIKAEILELPVEPYKNAQVDTEKIYGEILEVGISGEEEASFHQEKKGFYKKFLSNNPSLEELPLNTPVRLLYQPQNSDDTHEILCLKTANSLEEIREKEEVFGINAKNVEQQFALHALLDPEIPIVALTGAAGTGKTLICLASVLRMLKSSQYEKAKIARPMVELSDKTMGFLPGTVEEKIDPYFGPIYDNLEFLRSLKPEKSEKKAKMLRQQRVMNLLVRELWKAGWRNRISNVLLLTFCEVGACQRVWSSLMRHRIQLLKKWKRSLLVWVRARKWLWSVIFHRLIIPIWESGVMG